MVKLKLFYSIVLIFFISGSLAAENLADNTEQNLKVNISGIEHALQLNENKDFLNRVKLNNNSLESQNFAKHYSGKLANSENSWYRVSRIENHWTGVVSIDKHTYVIEEYVDLKTTESDSEYLKKILETKSSFESLTDEPLQCGVKSHDHQDTKSVNSANEIYQKLTNTKESTNLELNNFSKALISANSPVNLNQKSLANLCTDYSNGVCLLAEVEFVFDTLFQDAFSSLAVAQQEALAILNIVEGYYLNDFEVKFDTLTLEFLISDVFSTTLDSGLLLDDMRTKKKDGALSFVKNSKALLHLITGRDFTGSTAGTAYLGVLCHSSGANTGNSQLLHRSGSPSVAATALIVAHELGHNFGASHDGSGNTCSGAFIMSPSVNNDSTGFSSCSIDDISTEINSQSGDSACFNFPTDLGISANATNPNNVSVGQSIVTDYSITIDDSNYQQVSSININGSLPSGSGAFQTVSVNSSNCTITNSGQLYSCNLNTLTAPINLNVTSLVDSSSFEQTHVVSVGGSDEMIDVNQSNDSVLSSFTITELPTPNAASNAQASVDTSASADVVNLIWQDNSNNEDGFIIERNVNSGAFSELIQVASNTTSYTDSSVITGDTYAYRVLAFNADGNATASNTVTVTLGSVPNAASNAQASVDTSASADVVNLIWQDNSNNEDGFIIQRNVNSGSFTDLTQVTSNSSSYTDSTVSPGESYSYRVIAFNAEGNAAASNTANVTLGSTPNAASNAQASVDASGITDVVNLTWLDNSNNEDGFIIQRNVNSGSFTDLTQVTSNSSSYTDSTVSQGESYSYRVLAFNAKGNATASNTASATISSVPSGSVPNAASNAQAIVDASGSFEVVNLIWQDNSDNEVGFSLERRVNSGSFTQLVQLTANVTSYTDNTVIAGESYTYRVIAFNSVGASAISNTVTVVISSEPSGASSLTATEITSGTSNSVDLVWQDNSDNENEFIIERSDNSGAFSELASVAADVVTYSDSTVSASSVYAYRVTATNEAGDGKTSNEASVTTAATPTPPTAASTPTPANNESSGGGGSLGIGLLGIFLWLLFVKRIRFNTLRNALLLKSESYA